MLKYLEIDLDCNFSECRPVATADEKLADLTDVSESEPFVLSLSPTAHEEK